MPPWLTKQLITDIIFCTILFSAGYEVRVKLDEANKEKELAAQIVAQKNAQDAEDAKAAQWETQLAALRGENERLQGRLKHETAKAIYSKCVVPDNGVQLFNAALSGSDSAGKPAGSMP